MARDRRSGWWAFAAFLAALGGMIASWIAQEPGDHDAQAVTFALGALAIATGIYAAVGALTRCPSCNAWFRRELVQFEELGSQTVMRDGEAVTVTNYRNHYRCKGCSHRWHTASSS